MRVYGRNELPFSLHKLDAAGDSLPLTLINQRARSIAVSTANSCVIGGDLPKLTTAQKYLFIPQIPA